MRRIFIKDVLQEHIIITGSDAHHLGRVMRAKAGDHIVVADDMGKVAECEITGFTENTVELKLLQELEERTESPVEITLVQCLPKGDKLELITQKATELGINSIVPVISANCVVKYDSKKAKAKQDKWQKIANEAGKQCGRSQLPEVQPVQTLKQWLENNAGDAALALWMCYENEEQQGIKEFLKANTDKKRFAIVIGPEGGFSLEEAELARSLGIASVSLGTRILRAETAAIAAMTIVQYENGDLGGR